MQIGLSRCAVAGCIALALVHQAVAAQESEPFEVGAQITAQRFRELDSTDAGIGGRASWYPSRWIGVEGELNFYPNDIPDRLAISGNRVEGLFGVTAGPTLKAWRPFARIRPGFLRVGSSPQPIACILIFPPTLSCALAGGETVFAVDIGAGLEAHTPGRTFVRFDIGDRMLRLSGPARDRDNQVHDNDFLTHDLRVAIGAGWRF